MFIVEMVHGKYDDPTSNFAEFRCRDSNWKALLELGKANGWVPLGTVREDTLHSEFPILGDYKVGNWAPDPYNIFTAPDALALAHALERYLETIVPEISTVNTGSKLISDDMSRGQFAHINSDLSPEFIQSFISFLYCGDFLFVWED